MMPEHLATGIDDLALVLLHQPGGRQEFLVVLVRHKADFLALLLFRRLQAHAPGNLACLALLQVAQRKHHMCELLLPKREQEVRLIFSCIPTPQHHCSAVALLKPRVVAGGHVLRAKLPGAVDQVAKLEFLVAHHARVWRPTCLVLRRKIVDDIPLKLPRFINEIVRKVEFVRD